MSGISSADDPDLRRAASGTRRLPTSVALGLDFNAGAASHVRDLRDQAHTIGALGIVERANRDAQWPEHFLSLPRAQPVLDIVLMKYEMCCH
jgi:hypothetical protein